MVKKYAGGYIRIYTVNVQLPSNLCYAVLQFRVIALLMEAISTSELLINFYQTTWHNIPEDSYLHV
jgi:hypothetical protein